MAVPAETVDLTLIERNDPDVSLALTEDGSPLDLTGCTVEVYFKQNESQEDDDPGNFSMTSPTDITIDNEAGGECTVHVPAEYLPQKDERIWRADVVDSNEKRHTCIMGKLTVVGI